MTIKELIKKLQEYPEDCVVYVMGFHQPCSTSWEAWHSSKLIFKFDADDKTSGLEIEGDLSRPQIYSPLVSALVRR